MHLLRYLLLISIAILHGCGGNEIKQNDVSMENISTVFLKAEDAYKNKDYDKAKMLYQKVLRHYPTHIAAAFKLGNISMRERDWDKAIIYYSDVLKIKPNHAKAHHNLAVLYLHRSKSHFTYYIANNRSMNNKELAKLLNAMDDYAMPATPKKTSLDLLADMVSN